MCTLTDRCFSLKQRKRKLLKCTSLFGHPVCVTIVTYCLLYVERQQLVLLLKVRCSAWSRMCLAFQYDVYESAANLLYSVTPMWKFLTWKAEHSGKIAFSFLSTCEWTPQEWEKSTLCFTHNSRNHLYDVINGAYTSPGFVTTHPARSLFQSTRLPCLYFLPNMWKAQQSRKAGPLAGDCR